jgi:hypothetical protein
VDLYHARENLHEPARLLEFMLGDHRGKWLGELDGGDIGAITAAARAFPLTGTKAQARDKALGYFETNAHRMRYQHYRSLGMFVGSGAVEVGCKAGHRPAPPVVRHALVLQRRDRHPRPAMPASQRRWEEIWRPRSQAGAA